MKYIFPAKMCELAPWRSYIRVQNLSGIPRCMRARFLGWLCRDAANHARTKCTHRPLATGSSMAQNTRQLITGIQRHSYRVWHFVFGSCRLDRCAHCHYCSRPPQAFRVPRSSSLNPEVVPCEPKNRPGEKAAVEGCAWGLCEGSRDTPRCPRAVLG